MSKAALELAERISDTPEITIAALIDEAVQPLVVALEEIATNPDRLFSNRTLAEKALAEWSNK